jgi:biofilm PGA synthesis N-glycosyltransferase PgaC
MSAAEWLLAAVALYPVLTASLWMIGGLLFRVVDERRPELDLEGGWPGVTVLIHAYNEEAVIATSVQAAEASDYPELEVLVLDDGSTDRTAEVAREAAGPCTEVVRDETNRGKAAQLNAGFARAQHELVVVTDADAHLHPEAIRFLVARIDDSPLIAAVAGAPHVTNRDHLICAMQVLEAASIIGLIRRTQSLTGRVGTVAGVLGLFRRDRVLAVGGYDPRMATEDIDLTWRLLMAGGQTAYEPRALVGMQVPPTLRALWAQRRRWARGQGEVLRTHLSAVSRWRNHRMWLLSVESVSSLIWVLALVASFTLAPLRFLGETRVDLFGFGIAWGCAISVVATLQLIVALVLSVHYDRWDLRSVLVGAIYPLLFWLVSAAAAIHSQVVALARGPRAQRVVWNLPRDEQERVIN